MKNLLEAAEDYTKQAGLAGPGRVEVLHVRSGLAAGAGRTAPLAQKGGPGRGGALRSRVRPAGGEIPGAGRAAHTGDGRKTGTPRILLQKMRGRAGCGPAMMDARS